MLGIFGALFLTCLIRAESDNNVSFVQNREQRRNYTANDLIRELSKLASESIPRLRFPSNDYDDIPDDPNYRFPPNFQDPQVNQEQDSNNGNPAFNQQQNYNQPQIYNQQQNFNQPSYVDYQNQGANPSNIPIVQNQQQGYRPPRRRPKKQRPYRYRPQNYPYQQDQYPQAGFPQVYPGQRPYPQDYPQPGGQGFQQDYPQFGQGFPQDPYQDGTYPSGGPPFPYQDQGPFSSLNHALSSIAKYDDQKCVPRLLCEVAAGGNPGGRQTSFLPSFLNGVNMESLFTLLSAFAGNAVSPFLVFGRAALLGVTSQGSPSSCRYAYPECPRDPDRLVEYLNNHNGGFFRFFSGFNGENNDLQQPQDQQNPQFGLGQLNQLFGQDGGQYPGQGLGQNIAQSLAQNVGQGLVQNLGQGLVQNLGQGLVQNLGQGVVQNLGQGLVQNLGQYLGQNSGQGQQGFYQNNGQYPQRYPGQFGAYNQRPYSDPYYNQGEYGYYRRYPFRYAQKGSNVSVESTNETNEARIQNNAVSSLHSNDRIQNLKYPLSNDLYLSQSYHHFDYAGSQNGGSSDQSWKFPEGSRVRESPNYIVNSIPNDSPTKNFQFPADGDNGQNVNVKRPKALFFPDNTDTRQNEELYFPTPLPYYDHSIMIFPDRTGTGNLKFDSTKLNQDSSQVFRNEAPYYDYNGVYNQNNNGNNYYNNKNRDTRFSNQYQSASSTKKYVYIVRGNGDPNHPEIVEAKSARESDAGIVAEEPARGRSGPAWLFPSPLQGVVYNDR